jgi:hypothetical protein
MRERRVVADPSQTTPPQIAFPLYDSLKNGPSDFGPPEHHVSCLDCSNEVVVADWRLDCQSMLRHVRSQFTVNKVDIGVQSGMDDGG